MQTRRLLSSIAVGAALVAATALASSCDSGGENQPPGSDAAGDTGPVTNPDGSTGPPGVTTVGTTRLLSKIEIARTLELLTGVAPEAIELIPPDSHGFLFDRVAASQSMSRTHLDGYLAVAAELAETLIETATLDNVASACGDAVLPPLVTERTEGIIGASIGMGPDWAILDDPGDPTWIGTLYAPDPTGAYSHSFAAAGRYRLELDIAVQDDAPAGVAVDLDGTEVHSESGIQGDHTVRFEVDAAETTAVIDLRFNGTDNLRLVLKELRITGPLADMNAGGTPAEQRACAESIVEELAPLAWRRPLDDTERGRLLAVYDAGMGAAALSMLLQAIFASPHFLYVVEVGTPVADRPGVRELSSWEIATRLSYTLCEQPPDTELREAAASDTLRDPSVLESHARRLLADPCARHTVARFYQQWLWLNHLEGLNKSPEAFPAFDAETLAGMKRETDTYIDEMVWGENASLETFFNSDVAWPDPSSAWVWGLDDVTEQSRRTLPPERRGVLTLPGTLAVTAPFDTTSPVERGVFIGANILCAPLPPPPADLNVAPPLPDPTLTTRERWAAHSAVEACAGCHALIDPLGFAFENFDGIGVHRTTENGMPIDARGGVPQVDIADGELEGGAELSLALSDTEQLAECFAKQWLTFSLGRRDDTVDDASVAAMAEVIASGSMMDGIVSFMTTESFLLRYEVEDEETP